MPFYFRKECPLNSGYLTLLVTCKQNEVEPEDWLREVIEKLNDWPSNQVHELLPWNFSSVK
ncbi:transposase domain-containing protein [Shigella boydii]|uniref:Transposase domain-containing protein n=1 Tax=Shigella boydii TaxID=621 RepID=A0A7G6KD80_SHIBO|nr:transposase domain-containing protein [Shigella boydii]QNC65173.1 transposase domain-containing protein [Shigella boydii]WNT63076.1 transposase domain-containing protein [Shigella boydii]